MAKLNILKDIEIKTAKPKEKKYLLSDGGGLFICIKPDGSKVWIFRFTYQSKKRDTTFKTYPLLSLIQARAKREEYQALLNQGINPIVHNKEQKQEQKKEVGGVFKTIANEWLEKKKTEIAPKTYTKKKSQLENAVYPFIGDKHIKDIKVEDIVNLIHFKEKQASETAKKIFQDIKNIFKYSKLKGFLEHSVLADIVPRDILAPTITKHHEKVTDPIKLKEMIRAIYLYRGDTAVRNALSLCLHLPIRAYSLATLKWDYVNFEDKTLILPRDFLKEKDPNREDFWLPLTDEAIAILKEQYIFTKDKEYIFISKHKHKHINPQTPTKRLEDMDFNEKEKGKRITLHSFRGTFRTTVDNLDIQNRFSREVKDKALDHLERNAVARAYNKATYKEQMRELFNFWSDYLLRVRGEL